MQRKYHRVRLLNVCTYIFGEKLDQITLLCICLTENIYTISIGLLISSGAHVFGKQSIYAKHISPYQFSSNFLVCMLI